MEDGENSKTKEIDLMEKYNNPCNYDQKKLFDIEKTEVERTINAYIKSLDNRFKQYCFKTGNFQSIKIDIYKLYEINLSEKEYNVNNLEIIATNIIKKLTEFLNNKKTFEEKLITFISFDYVLSIGNEIIHTIANNIKDFYDIYQGGDGRWHCIPKHDLEIITWAEQEPSLQSVMKYYYQNDIKKALGELRKITEFNNSKNEKFKNFVLKQPNELQEMCKKVYDFITKCENHNDGFENATINEQRIWLDLGLSIYRLFLMSDEK